MWGGVPQRFGAVPDWGVLPRRMGAVRAWAGFPRSIGAVPGLGGFRRQKLRADVDVVVIVAQCLDDPRRGRCGALVGLRHQHHGAARNVLCAKQGSQVGFRRSGGQGAEAKTLVVGLLRQVPEELIRAIPAGPHHHNRQAVLGIPIAGRVAAQKACCHRLCGTSTG